MIPGMPGAWPVGREHEIGLIGRLLEDVQTGGGALVLEGVAGIGKSALLAEAQRIAGHRDMAVMSTTGVQSETDLPFAGLHQLMRPVLARVGELPAPQRDAVCRAFGMGEGAAPAPFLIAL